MMEFLGMLLKYRIYFLLFELTLYPSIHLFRKWRDAKGRQRKEYQTKMEVAIFISSMVYFALGCLCIYIFGLDEFREIAWLAVMAKVVFMPAVMAIRWITSKTVFRKEVVDYVKDRKSKGLLEVDIMVSVIPGIILYFVMLPFALGAGVVGFVFGLLTLVAYRDSSRIRGNTNRLSTKQMIGGLWKDHRKFGWSIGLWLVLYLLLGGSSKVTYVLPILVFAPIAINMDLNIRKHKILKMSKVIDDAEKTID